MDFQDNFNSIRLLAKVYSYFHELQQDLTWLGT
jgi:hypothetical protein